MEDNYTQHSKPQHKGISPVVYIVAAVVLVALSFLGALAYLKHNNKSAQVNTSSTGSGNSGQSLYLSSGNGNTPAPSSSSPTSSCPNGEPTLMLDIGGQQTQSCGQPAQGQASSVSATSITVQPSSGAAQTFSITSSTKIIQQNQSAGTWSDISTGETVVVIASSSSANQAAYILINPNLSAQ